MPEQLLQIRIKAAVIHQFGFGMDEHPENVIINAIRKVGDEVMDAFYIEWDHIVCSETVIIHLLFYTGFFPDLSYIHDTETNFYGYKFLWA